MNLQRVLVWLAVGGLLAAVLVVSLPPIPPDAAAENECPKDWYLLSSPEERDRCAELKGLLHERKLQDDLATVQARPYATTIPHPIDFGVHGTPVPPGFIPEEAKAIKKVPKENVVGIHELKGTNSVWQIGAVPDLYQQGYNRVYLFARPGDGTRNASLGLYLFGGYPSPDNRKMYNKIWESPRDVGVITITGVSASAGQVSFVSSSGATGAFDLASETWVFTD